MNLGEALLAIHSTKQKPISQPKKVAKPYKPSKSQLEWETEILSVLEHPMTINEILAVLNCSRTTLRENLDNMYSHSVVNRSSLNCKGGRQFLYWRKAK